MLSLRIPPHVACSKRRHYQVSHLPKVLIRRILLRKLHTLPNWHLLTCLLNVCHLALKSIRRLTPRDIVLHLHQTGIKVFYISQKETKRLARQKHNTETQLSSNANGLCNIKHWSSRKLGIPFHNCNSFCLSAFLCTPQWWYNSRGKRRFQK